ncbi:hypothetical protein Pcinc_037345 [Petrolisthes cinctipes]|uniref:Uncharacterized protein n=1 Tax=Petrolisthes cinctipes TaxID=88211 RepID=A0AAE1BSQ4_PETCI|nr:hypothetical protein Pcinc_037345 [Petrolisthes cinctipes]
MLEIKAPHHDLPIPLIQVNNFSQRKLIYQWQFPSFSTPAAPRRQLLPGLATTPRLPPRRLLPGLATTPPPFPDVHNYCQASLTPAPQRPQLLPALLSCTPRPQLRIHKPETDVPAEISRVPEVFPGTSSLNNKTTTPGTDMGK